MFDFESTKTVCARASGMATHRQAHAATERVIAATRFGTHTGTKRRMGSPFAWLNKGGSKTAIAQSCSARDVQAARIPLLALRAWMRGVPMQARSPREGQDSMKDSFL